LVEQYLAFAEAQAQAQRPMYMKDWIRRARKRNETNEIRLKIKKEGERLTMHLF